MQADAVLYCKSLYFRTTMVALQMTCAYVTNSAQEGARTPLQTRLPLGYRPADSATYLLCWMHTHFYLTVAVLYVLPCCVLCAALKTLFSHNHDCL